MLFPMGLATMIGAPMLRTLIWVEAGDHGDPNVKTPVRDRLIALSAPFEKPVTLQELPLRLSWRAVGQ